MTPNGTKAILAATRPLERAGGTPEGSGASIAVLACLKTPLAAFGTGS